MRFAERRTELRRLRGVQRRLGIGGRWWDTIERHDGADFGLDERRNFVRHNRSRVDEWRREHERVREYNRCSGRNQRLRRDLRLGRSRIRRELQWLGSLRFRLEP
jgi:hypothetical protein